MPPDAMATVAQNPQVVSLKSKLADLQHQKAQLAERYGDKHPQVEAVNTSLLEVQHQLEAETSKALQQMRSNTGGAAPESKPLTPPQPRGQCRQNEPAPHPRPKSATPQPD